MKQNLIREIKVLSKLNHKNIMKLYESIDTLSNVYLISEYVQGRPLNEYILEQKKLNQQEAVYIIYQLMQAIAYLHSKCICHRDIKLENIIIDPITLTIKLIDFGFSLTTNANSMLKLFCGTP